MGYTHYFTQTRSFTAAEWETVTADVQAILKEAEHNQGIPLADGNGGGGTSPEFTALHFAFNGLGDGAHETMYVTRHKQTKKEYEGHNPAWSFCKTAEKPYDAAVVAVLCYLATITRRDDPTTGEPIIGSEVFRVTSDGKGVDFLSGLDLARQALPRKANQLDLPMAIMQNDRWCAPWVNDSYCKGYEVHFCVDGKGYVLKTATRESYCFESHMALAQFLSRNKRATFTKGGRTSFGTYPAFEEDIWNAYGSFDPARHKRIARAQAAKLAPLFPVDPACAQQPPAYVRPNQMPDNGGRTFCYSINDLLNLAVQ